jgi:hypothetical protein
MITDLLLMIALACFFAMYGSDDKPYRKKYY